MSKLCVKCGTTRDMHDGGLEVVMLHDFIPAEELQKRVEELEAELASARKRIAELRGSLGALAHLVWSAFMWRQSPDKKGNHAVPHWQLQDLVQAAEDAAKVAGTELMTFCPAARKEDYAAAIAAVCADFKRICADFKRIVTESRSR